jgi:hypothetical protein
LSHRFHDQALPDSGQVITREDYELMLREYYQNFYNYPTFLCHFKSYLVFFKILNIILLQKLSKIDYIHLDTIKNMLLYVVV